MNKAVIKALQAEQNRLEKDLHKVRLALSAFKTGREERESKTTNTKVFRKRYKGICQECNQPYTAKKSGTRFCSHSCAGKAWDRKNRPRTSRIPAQPQKTKPVTLLPGDPIRAAH